MTPERGYRRRALITGITGQDGSYLAEFLVSRGYEVYGLIRSRGASNPWRIQHLRRHLTLLEGDLLDQGSLCRVLRQVRPGELYNLASQSFVPTSWQEPVLTGEVNALGTARLLAAVRLESPATRCYQASSSEMFGNVGGGPLDENSAFHPRSPYGVAKLFGHQITVNYRESHAIFAVSGIAFNHESPRRGLHFVTRKVARAAAAAKLGLLERLPLGTLSAQRDWGHARDYVVAMWAMLQRPDPEDLVLATGTAHSVEDLCKMAFDHVGMSHRDFVEVDSTQVRPADIDMLVGNPNRAADRLGWIARTSFEDLIREMVDADLTRLRRHGVTGADALDPLGTELPDERRAPAPPPEVCRGGTLGNED